MLESRINGPVFGLQFGYALDVNVYQSRSSLLDILHKGFDHIVAARRGSIIST